MNLGWALLVFSPENFVVKWVSRLPQRTHSVCFEPSAFLLNCLKIIMEKYADHYKNVTTFKMRLLSWATCGYLGIPVASNVAIEEILLNTTRLVASELI